MSTKSIWRHIKTGGIYDLMVSDAVLERDMTKVVVYRSLKDGVIWIRDKDEFFDGRFEPDGEVNDNKAQASTDSFHVGLTASYRPFNLGTIFPPQTTTEYPREWYLEGWHKASGQWVKLAHFENEQLAHAAIMSCHSQTQPDKKKVSIIWGDFSAFKASPYTNVKWMR